jgi:hypothetical protein
MPDDNKFKKLREVGYTVPVTCGLCVHGPKPPGDWGECGLHRYMHLRQNNPEGGRGISVHVSGTCDTPELDHAKAASLGAHYEFLGQSDDDKV